MDFTCGDRSRTLILIISLMLFDAQIMYGYLYALSSQSEIPDDIPEGVTSLVITSGSISVIPTAAFRNLSQCEQLYLNNNNISVIEHDAWLGLTNLVGLNLNFNMLTVIHTHDFDHLNGCTQLELRGNHIHTIEDNAWLGLTHLLTLYLQQNMLTVIHTHDFDHLDGCTLLYLSINHIHTIEDNAWLGLGNLDTLYLYDNNKLTVIHTHDFDHLDECTLLDLRYNHIHTIQKDSFIHMSNLRTLNLHVNQLTQLDRDTFQGLHNLDTLDLSDNNISCIEAGTFHNIPLHNIYLHDNSLKILEWTAFTDNLAEHRLSSIDVTLRRNPLECDSRMAWVIDDDQLNWIDVTLDTDCVNDLNTNWTSIPSKDPTGYASTACQIQKGIPSDTRCAQGTYLSDVSTCIPCPLHSYNPQSNHVIEHCFPCPSDYTTEYIGTSSIDHCLLLVSCPPGSHIDDSECIPCDDGSYQPKHSQESCIKCPGNLWTTGGVGATTVDQCTTVAEQRLSFSMRNQEETFTDVLLNVQSLEYLIMQNTIANILTPALEKIRYFKSWQLEGFRSGSIIADIAVILLDHTDAKDIFIANLYNLKLSLENTDLFQWSIEFDLFVEEVVDFVIYNIKPIYGPKAGGTLMTINGRYLDIYGPPEVYIGTQVCPLYAIDSDRIVCVSSPSDTLLNVQDITISWPLNGNKANESARFMFTYKPDPIIEDIKPVVTISSGGVPITVTGSNMDSVAEPVMVVTAVSTDTISIYYQACVVFNSTKIECATPPLIRSPERQKRQTSPVGPCHIEMKYHNFENYHQLQDDNKGLTYHEPVEIWVEFIMDSSITEKKFQLTVKADPSIKYQLEPVDFIPHWPCADESVIIKGSMLLEGLSANIYSVYMGDKECIDVEVTMSSITCSPPQQEPASSLVNVVIGTGCLQQSAYNLNYGSRFDCKPFQYGFGSVFAALIAIILVVISVVCWIRKKRRRGEPKPAGTEMASIYNTMPKMMETAVTAGHQSTDNYDDNIVDGNTDNYCDNREYEYAYTKPHSRQPSVSGYLDPVTEDYLDPVTEDYLDPVAKGKSNNAKVLVSDSTQEMESTHYVDAEIIAQQEGTHYVDAEIIAQQEHEWSQEQHSNNQMASMENEIRTQQEDDWSHDQHSDPKMSALDNESIYDNLGFNYQGANLQGHNTDNSYLEII